VATDQRAREWPIRRRYLTFTPAGADLFAEKKSGPGPGDKPVAAMKCWHLALETRQRNLNPDDAKPFQLTR
jgi:hypothetical protein